MKKLLFIFSIVSIIYSCSDSQSENQQTTTIENEKTAQLDTLYSKLFQKEAFNGVVLIAEKGIVIFEKAFGNANEAENRKLKVDTKFELASLSKQFTAMGIVQLKKQGRLNYEDDFSKYIPELPHYKGITIKNLLTHTSGLPDYMDLAEVHWDKSKIATNDDMIQLFEKHQPKTLFLPNEKYEYSNTGYMLLGTIIERVSESSFEDYLTEKIFKPLNMINTFIYRRRFAPEKIENYADGYIFSDSLKAKLIPDSLADEAYVIYLDGIVGDGMVNSNLRDLFQWDRALYINQLINETDRKDIFSTYFTTDSSSTDYGFGWNVDSSKVYGNITKHSGGWAGYLSYIERHTDNDRTIIILQNNLTPKITLPLKNTRRILYNLPVEHPIELDSSILQKYAGIYLTNSGKEKPIFYKNGQLLYPIEPDFNLKLIPVSTTKFILDGFRPEVTYTFQLDEKGNVTHYRAQQLEQEVDKILTRKN